MLETLSMRARACAYERVRCNVGSDSRAARNAARVARVNVLVKPLGLHPPAAFSSERQTHFGWKDVRAAPSARRLSRQRLLRYG